MSSRPLVSLVWISFGWLLIIFCSFCLCSFVLHVYNMSFKTYLSCLHNA